MNMTKVSMWIATIWIAGVSNALAKDTQEQVIDCLGEVGTTSTWNSCLNVMFAPCGGMIIGSEEHIACLIQQRDDWRIERIGMETQVLRSLSEEGKTELGSLMLAWPKFVEDKCKVVAESRADVSYNAAFLGCQISEIALFTNELTACHEDRSIEDYCEKKP